MPVSANDVARRKDELAKLEAEARRREVAATVAEGKLDEWKERIAEFKRRELAWNTEPLPGGGSRELDLSPPGRDPVYARPAREAETETELVRVPGHGQAHTLTQSRPKRTMRRVNTNA